MAGPQYVDSRTGIAYVSDAGFIDAGLVHTVDPGNLQLDLVVRFFNLRYFPSGARNCYTLRSLTPGGKYLVRAAFGYGDYDKLNRLPTFDLYFGVNFWATVNIVNSSTAYSFEIIAVSPADFLQICLVNIGSGTPFISALDLSFFRDTVGFGFNRYHFGTDYGHISWTDVSNKSDGAVQNSPNSNYDAPSVVMRSASTPLNGSRMDISWSADASMGVGVDTKYFLALYFAELVAVQDLRQFDVSVDNRQLASGFSPNYLLATVLTEIVQGSGEHSVSLLATSNSTLQPLISAMEIFMVWPRNESTTSYLDAIAMMTIQMKFAVKRNWMGDPCAPISFAWDGLNCSYTPDGPPRITALNLSSSGLVGEIDASFGQLTLLQRLDLSSNDLSGPIPMNLLQKSQDRFLTLRKKKSPEVPRSANPFTNWRFKYKELELITNNFNTLIGRSGFGPVYFGRLENGTPVAVKMRSETSSQGNTEFFAEAQHLARVHHRNLVSLIGCCKDKKHLSLVYEYMDGGNLQDRLGGHKFRISQAMTIGGGIS
ncbi:hypothetical protein BRADI_4g09464v3 [Brachypodium distachyon]|uniref:Protein kinase domain-containing protein n=1 Tax=Brachypodium distachyon TaxID=15368 RepID=A0A0Q3H1B5_BRADI|nr:hypothetical protein BRADI_4g09464v3 [Brachypodium distachyon]